MQKLLGSTRDISILLHFHFYEEVYYKLHESERASKNSTKEGRGWMIGFAENVGQPPHVPHLDSRYWHSN